MNNKGKCCRTKRTEPHTFAAKISAVLTVAVVASALIPGSVADANIEIEKLKSETVYAVLEDSGAYTGATVVNCFAQGGEIVDYGAYTSIENLMGAASAVVDGDTITWPASATATDGDFYYQGTTNKALPFNIGIRYYLNGHETTPDDIAGKTGELKIAFEIENVTGEGEVDELSGREIFTPFAVQVSLSMDSDMFTVTDMPKNATSVQAGSSLSVSYTSFPLPSDTFSFTLFGQDMTLEPINIIALPKAPPGLDAYGDFVDVEGMRDGIDEMEGGTDEMKDGTDTLLSALYGMKDAAGDLSSALEDIDSGAASLADGADTVHDNACALAASAGDFYAAMGTYAASFAAFDAGMDELHTAVLDMAATLQELSDAAALLDAGVIGVGDGARSIALSNADFTALAGSVAAAYPDADTAALAAGLNLQQAVIDALTVSCTDLEALSDGVRTGVGGFYTEFSTTFSDSVLTLRTSSSALYASCLDLLSAADALDSGCAGLSAAVGRLESGADGLGQGISDVLAAMPSLISGIDEMIGGVADLDAGLTTLGNDGLVPMRDTLDGLDGYLQILADRAAAYGSFMDVRNADICTVQFVMKTQGIGAEK